MPSNRPSSSNETALTSRPSSRASLTSSVRYSSPVVADASSDPIVRWAAPFEERTDLQVALDAGRATILANDEDSVVVVHGHTIVDKVEQRSNRIALDTGAYRSGVLTAIGLEGGERWFIEARSDAPAEALGSALAG